MGRGGGEAQSQSFSLSLSPSFSPLTVVNPVFAFHSYLMVAEFFLGNHHLPKTPPPPIGGSAEVSAAGRPVGEGSNKGKF